MHVLKKVKDNLKKDVIHLKSDLLMAMPRLYRKPIRLMIYVTERCNSRCITCHLWKGGSKKNLPKKHIFKFVDEAFKFSRLKTVALCGGEPLLRKDIYDIVEYIKSRNGYPQISTNGILLTKETIDQLVQSGIATICMSLNGVDPKIHDSSRGVKGNLITIFKAVDYIKKNYPKVEVCFTMIIFKQNLNQIIPAIKYANDVNAYISFRPIEPVYGSSNYKNGREKTSQIFQELLPDDFDKISLVLNQIKTYNAMGHIIWPPNSVLKSYLDYFENPRKRRIKKCKIGFASMILCNNGDIKLCYSYPPIGNIMQCNLKDLWISKVAKEKRKQMLKCKKNCATFCTLTPNLRDIFRRYIYFAKERII